MLAQGAVGFSGGRGVHSNSQKAELGMTVSVCTTFRVNSGDQATDMRISVKINGFVLPVGREWWIIVSIAL